MVGGTTSDIDQSVVAVGEYEKKEKLQEILTSAGKQMTHLFLSNHLSPAMLSIQELTGHLCLWRLKEMQII